MLSNRITFYAYNTSISGELRQSTRARTPFLTTHHEIAARRSPIEFVKYVGIVVDALGPTTSDSCVIPG